MTAPAITAQRTPAWHRLGHDVSMTDNATDALALSGLSGWDVRTQPIAVTAPLRTIPIKNRVATVRTNPDTGAMEYLGVVGKVFRPIQNESLADMMDILIGESGAGLETAGSMDGGNRVFLTMKMPEALTIDAVDGTDVTDLYLAGFNSHDGSSAMRLMITPVRVMCCNMQTFAMSKALNSVVIRHTESAIGRINEIRHALGLVDKYVGEYRIATSRMVSTPMDHDAARFYFRQVFGLAVPDEAAALSERTLNTRTAHVESAMALFDGPTNANVQGTAYAALNAVTEHVDWMWKARGADDQDMARAMRVVSPQFVQVKSRAFALASTFN